MTGPGRSRGACRYRRHERTALGAAAIVAVIVHAAAAGAASATNLFGAGWGPIAAVGTARPQPKPARAAPLKPSCDGDAVLAVAARALTCASPFVASPAACLTELANRLESDRLLCHVEEFPTVAFTFDQADATQLPQLNPEPLLEMLTPERQQQFEQQQEEQLAALVAEAQRQKQALARDQQIIETVKPTVEIAPDDTRFVSEHNTKVDHQTVARGTPDEELVARSKPAELEVRPDPRDPSLAEPRKEDLIGTHPEAPRAPGTFTMRTLGAPQPADAAQDAHERGVSHGSADPIGDGTAARRGDGRIAIEERRPSELPSGEGGAGGGSPRVPDLRASEEVLERALGGGSVDHLEDVDEGNETALNSKQWVYATFFNRMKRRVAQNWQPGPLWWRRDPTGTVYGSKNRTTRLRVTLGPTGALQKVVVVSPSGVDFLDDEAIRAFRAAQPFPNPPSALLDASGAISFEFGFHLEVGSSGKSSWKIFRAL